MKSFTERQRQWLWFVGLYGLGLTAFLALAMAVKWVLRALPG